jgi:hypothetical protein
MIFVMEFLYANRDGAQLGMTTHPFGQPPIA